MIGPKNQAAWLNKAGEALQVGDAPLPTAGAGEIVVENAAVAINLLDTHMQDVGVFVQQWPTVFGCDVAGEVFQVGEASIVSSQEIVHCINLVTGRLSDGAYALYTVVPSDKAAIVPDHISYTDGVVAPFAVEAAVCALSVKEHGPCMPEVSTPALNLPYPTLQDPVSSANKTIVVYGASSSVGAMTTQIAAATGIKVIVIAGAHNHDLVKTCGASRVFDHKDSSVVEKVVDAVKATGSEFVGIFDAISIPETYARDLAILEKLGGGHLTAVHPPPTEGVPENVKTGMIFAVNDVTTPVYKEFVVMALQSGKLKCLPPPTLVGKGLKYVNEGLNMSKAGVSATKLVVEL